MAETRRLPVFGVKPPCAYSSRIEKCLAKTVELERSRNPERPNDFVRYGDSDNKELVLERLFQNELLTSYNAVDYVRSRESSFKENRHFKPEYGTRRILKREMLKERPIFLAGMNKIFCSEWLNDRKVIFGTKCHKLVVLDVVTRRSGQIPSLATETTSTAFPPRLQGGIRCLRINPSRTLLATAARRPNDIAFYSLPTLDPVCVGEDAHRYWMLDMCWLDDQLLVSCSWDDDKMALWKVEDPHGRGTEDAKKYSRVTPLASKSRKTLCRAHTLAFNRSVQEIVTISQNRYVQTWTAETFQKKASVKLPLYQDNMCIAVRHDGSLYSIGCGSNFQLLDSRTLQTVRKIYPARGVRSLSFQDDLMTVGTSKDAILFYDLRAMKYLKSSVNPGSPVVLTCSRGNVFPSVRHRRKCSQAVFTHCYDSSATRLFAAGGPLAAVHYGNYAGLWR